MRGKPKGNSCASPQSQEITDRHQWLGKGVNRLLRRSDFRGVGDIAQQVVNTTKKHDADDGPQIVPVLFAGTKFGTAILIAAVAQLQNLMDVKGQQVEHKKGRG